MKIDGIKLAALWLGVILTYLLGDVLRIYAGDVQPGKVDGQTMSSMGWLGVAIMMLVPIIMIIINIYFQHPSVLIANIVLSLLLFLFNGLGLPTYHAPYDIFLIVVSLLINVLIIWLSWIMR